MQNNLAKQGYSERLQSRLNLMDLISHTSYNITNKQTNKQPQRPVKHLAWEKTDLTDLPKYIGISYTLNMIQQIVTI